MHVLKEEKKTYAFKIDKSLTGDSIDKISQSLGLQLVNVKLLTAYQQATRILDSHEDHPLITKFAKKLEALEIYATEHLFNKDLFTPEKMNCPRPQALSPDVPIIPAIWYNYNSDYYVGEVWISLPLWNSLRRLDQVVLLFHEAGRDIQQEDPKALEGEKLYLAVQQLVLQTTDYSILDKLYQETNQYLEENNYREQVELSALSVIDWCSRLKPRLEAYCPQNPFPECELTQHTALQARGLIVKIENCVGDILEQISPSQSAFYSLMELSRNLASYRIQIDAIEIGKSERSWRSDTERIIGKMRRVNDLAYAANFTLDIGQKTIPIYDYFRQLTFREGNLSRRQMRNVSTKIHELIIKPMLDSGALLENQKSF